jgi:hypothetical protein
MSLTRSASDQIRGLFIDRPAMPSGGVLLDLQLRVIAALPVEDKHDVSFLKAYDRPTPVRIAPPETQLRRQAEQAAPALDPPGILSAEQQGLPDRRRDGVVNWDAEGRLHTLRQRRAAQVGAEDRDRVRLSLCHPADSGLKRCLIHLREAEILRESEVALGHHLNADAGVCRDDPRLNLGQVRRDEPDAPGSGQRQRLVEGKHGGAGLRTARGLDLPAEGMVGVEAEPAGGGAVPGNHLAAGIGEQACRAKQLLRRELGERAVTQRDLGDPEPTKMRRSLGDAGEDAGRHRLEHRVGGRCQHSDQSAFGHVFELVL